MSNGKINFLDNHKESITIGSTFWEEASKRAIIFGIELQYKPEIIKEWTVIDIVPTGDKFLLKWAKRPYILSDAQYKAQYK